MRCHNCGFRGWGRKTRVPGKKLIICPECDNQILLRNTRDGTLIILERQGKDGEWKEPDDPAFFTFFVNEFLLDEGTDILVYSQGERWSIPKGIGKSNNMMPIAMEVHDYGESLMYSNIRFIGEPEGLFYSEELGDLLYRAFTEKRKRPQMRILALVDEWSQFMDQHESGKRHGKLVNKLLKLTRKIPINFIAISPNYDDFPIALKRNNVMHLIKDPDRVLDLRDELDDDEIHPEEILFIEGSSRLGRWHDYIIMGLCDWSDEKNRIHYDHASAADFRVSDWLIENRHRLNDCLKMPGPDKIQAVYSFLSEYYSPQARARREAGQPGPSMSRSEELRICVKYLLEKIKEGQDTVDVQILKEDGTVQWKKVPAVMNPSMIARVTGCSKGLVNQLMNEAA